MRKRVAPSSPLTAAMPATRARAPRRLRVLPVLPVLPVLRVRPLAQAVAVFAASSAMIGAAHAQQAFSNAWFAARGAAQTTAAQTGRLPNGMPVSSLQNPGEQQQRANQALQNSIANLATAAQGIAAMQAAQTAARQAAAASPETIPDGLTEGGLKVDTHSLTAGWVNAKKDIAQSRDAAGNTNVRIEQTGEKAILNWETFNVGRRTTVEFAQQPGWAVLNRVNDPNARPSQIQGQIKADGTVVIVNRNGIQFSGTAQVDTRNLVAAAVGMTNDQFNRGLYGTAISGATVPTFANDLSVSGSTIAHGAATADVVVDAGARINTRKPQSVTEGGGYVLLLGREAHNRGTIVTPSGQTVIAGGDAFTIRRGMGTDGNPNSSTRGNEVEPRFVAGSAAGRVSNSGLIASQLGDITLAGRNVEQRGVLVSSTSVNTRGTIHLTASGDANAQVKLAQGAVTAILQDAAGDTALDVQRAALLAETAKVAEAGLYNRRDQSLVQVVSSADVLFDSDSLTLATGGQINVAVTRRMVAMERAKLDVSGAVGVQVAMSANNLEISVQGNEQRDAPTNRDSALLNNQMLFIDRRYLVRVPAGTQGYSTDRWYTPGGLLEVSGYLNTAQHGVGEWAAQGGTVQLGGAEVVTRAGSLINLAGGTLDVQTGMIRQSWLRGADGQLYRADNAPGDLRYLGVYRGFEVTHARWGKNTTEAYATPFVAPGARLENGYTVGRDAGRLIIASSSAVLEGDVDTSVYQGPRQAQAPDKTRYDGYLQSQLAAARGAQLIVGNMTPFYDETTLTLRDSPSAVVRSIDVGDIQALAASIALDAPNDAARTGKISLDAGWLNRQHFGGVKLLASERLTVSRDLRVADGGDVALHATRVNLEANVTARSGNIVAGNIVTQMVTGVAGGVWMDKTIADGAPVGEPYVKVADGVTLDTRGVWSRVDEGESGTRGVPYVDGGNVVLSSSGDVRLLPGSVVDVSSGAVLMSNGSVRGGKGGNVSLLASQYDLDGKHSGELHVDGELRAYGVSGGGTLKLDTGNGIVIGGPGLKTDGWLAAGETLPFGVTLLQDYTIKAGTIAPVDYKQTLTRALPGAALPSALAFSATNPVVTAADWTIPAAATGNFAIFDQNNRAYRSGQVLPAGSTITRSFGTPATTFVVPANVFPNGVPVAAYNVVAKAGTPLPFDVKLASGALVPAGLTTTEAVRVASPTTLDAQLFTTGFSRYDVNGQLGVTVADNARLSVVMPVLNADALAARDAQSGSDPSRVLSRYLPPVWQSDAVKGTISQRGGADLVINAGTSYKRAQVRVGEGAVVAVDPGRSITITGNDQITVLGGLRASSGVVSLLPGTFGTGSNADLPDGVFNARSIWLGGTAFIDVSAQPFTAQSASGALTGKVAAGGTIQIGAKYVAGATKVDAADAFVIVRPGARLDASGTAADIDVPGQGRTRVTSNGGVISLASARGLYLDGDMKAAAGGAGAAGGTLNVVLEALNYGPVDRATLAGANVEDAVRVAREMIIAQQQGASALADSLRAGATGGGLAMGNARIGVDRVAAGGFDNLSLLANGMIDFDGNVDLSMRQSLRLTASSFGQAANARGSVVKLSAPYVQLAGASRAQGEGFLMPNPVKGSKNAVGSGVLGAPLPDDDATFDVNASLIDLAGPMQFGTAGSIVMGNGGQTEYRRAAFGDVTLRSTGDLRLLDKSEVYVPGNLKLASAQLYPVSDATAKLVVGQRTYVNQWNANETRLDPARTLTIERVGDTLPSQPYSVFGNLTLNAPTIRQGGVVRAPMGTITFGEMGNLQVNSYLHLLPGSVTSVSAAGLTIPYGGSLDGLSYLYDGVDAKFALAGTGPSISAYTHSLGVDEGAVIDLSGGGEIRGAAFLTGRGGSVDARLSPLMQVVQSGNKASFRLPSLSTNPVYAILPGTQQAYAPVVKDTGALAPMIGQQITIGDGVPGLPAGTYTLLPSSFALLPGAYRVELQNGVTSQAGMAPLAMRNGSLTLPAQLSVNHTGIRNVTPTQAVLTSGDVLRSYSQYNEMSYADFARAGAARDGVPRSLIEADAKRLDLYFLGDNYIGKVDGLPSLRFDGRANVAPGKDGYGASLMVSSPFSGKFEILGAGGTPTKGDPLLVSLFADEINKIGVARMGIGGLPEVSADGQGALAATTAYLDRTGRGAVYSVTLRDGAILRAGEVFIVTKQSTSGITIELGSGINTLGYGMQMWDATTGYTYSPGKAGVLAVSNGRIALLAPTPGDSWNGAGFIDLGVCAAGATCTGDALLLSEGSIAVATDKRFTITDAVRYGTRQLSLSVGRVNVGEQASLAALAASGRLAEGLTLNQSVLSRLLRGDTVYGAPALESLSLIARDSINFYDSVALSTIDAATGKSSIDTLVLGTPAIYGFGASDAVARIRTNRLVWSGAKSPAGAIVAGGAGTGNGRLIVDAKAIELGYGPGTQRDVNNAMNRLAVGFSTVELNASERVTANQRGSLSVYRSQGAWNDTKQDYDYSGGDILVDTPMLTGEAGSVSRFNAGGNLSVANASGRAKPVLDNGLLVSALGAEVALTAGGTAQVNTNVVLPSGRLSVSALGDVSLGDGAQLDLAGRKLDFFDASKYSWGGDVIVSSANGNVHQAAGSRIDLSAQFNRAGKLTVAAVGPTGGVVSLAGKVLGSASGEYDAGGTNVPFAAGGLDVRAQRIDDFVGLNTRLNDGGVFGSRNFQTKQGDLVVGDEIRAREISLSVDGGRLEVLGKVDASGRQAGTIRLSARDGVTIGGNAQLDAHSTTLRLDSYGQPIEASNRAVIEINGNQGRVVLADGARFDVRAGTDGTPLNVGTVEISAARLGGATGNDIAIDASGRVVIDGARSITVNGMHRDPNAAPGTDTSVDGRGYQVINQGYLDRLHDQSTTFMTNALANGALLTRLAGLRRYSDAFHLRPGVEIVSATPDGDLHIDGDIDMSRYRYASLNPHTQMTGVYGSGEAGALMIRAGGNLNVYGSVTDGFDTSKLTSSPDTKGWVLTSGKAAWGGDAVVPAGGLVTLVAGTSFPAERKLNYDVQVNGASLPAGVRLPTRVTLTDNVTFPAGTVLGGAVRDASGNVVHAAGTVLTSPLTVTGAMQLDPGVILPTQAFVGPMTWPAGAVMPVSLVLAGDVALKKGAIIPAETDVRLASGAKFINVRPADADGNQGQNFAIAPMLQPGSASWSMRLVAGADTSAADPRALRPFAKDGHLVLADTHYGMSIGQYQVPGTGTPSVYRWGPAGADYFGATPGAIITEEELRAYDLTPEMIEFWNSIGDVVQTVVAGTPPVIATGAIPAREPLFSVVRTGTGDLDMLAGGNFTMNSLYGVYTAGTQAKDVTGAYNLARSKVKGAAVLGTGGGDFEKYVDGQAQSLYSAWYPEHGGNLLVRAQGDIRGDATGSRGNFVRDSSFGSPRQLIESSNVGNWLWRQGSGSAIAQGGVPTSWWINFGTYTPGRDSGGSYLDNAPYLLGFTGLGTLGGGNLIVEAGGNAGLLESRMGAGYLDPHYYVARSEGLNVAVASTGRVSADGSQIVLTGGGDLDVRIGGGLNPVREVRAVTQANSEVTDLSIWRNDNLGLYGSFTNLRGATRVEAGALGGFDAVYGGTDIRESRARDAFTAGRGIGTGGPTLVLGDSTARIDTRGDLVIGGYGDATRMQQRTNGTPFSANGVNYGGEGFSWFTLWTPSTAIDLFSAGGHLVPITAIADANRLTANYGATDGRFVLPATLRAVAASGSIYNGYAATYLLDESQQPTIGTTPALLAPEPVSSLFKVAGDGGALELIAGSSLYGGGYPISRSAADPMALPTAQHPAFAGGIASTAFVNRAYLTNVRQDALAPSILFSYGIDSATRFPLFSLTPATVSGYDFSGMAPARFYAVTGDIVGLHTGSIDYRGTVLPQPGTEATWYEGNGAVTIRAGRDIVNSGTPLGTFLSTNADLSGWKTTPDFRDPNNPGRPDRVLGSATTRGNLIVHNSADDVSVISAGRDIRYSTFYIAGPGLLEVTAGRDVFMGDKAELRSLGALANVTAGDRSNGAGIAVAVGVGPKGLDGVDFKAFAARYLDKGNLADAGRPLADQPGKAVVVYGGALTLSGWLAQEFGYSGDVSGAEAFLASKQADLDRASAAAGNAGGAAKRDLRNEYAQQSQLYLVNWLTTRFGDATKRNATGVHFDAGAMDTRQFFDALPAEQQRAYLRDVYFAELRASGREYNDATGPRAGSYLRGREAIATLFPSVDENGAARKYDGSLTMYSSAQYFLDNAYRVSTTRPQAGVKYLTQAQWIARGSPSVGVPHYEVQDAGIHTDFGGGVSIVAPGGRTLVGVDGGFVPDEGSGILTQGRGNVDLYSFDSILLGQSRIFTTFGGNVLAWSAQGDINAGRGSKSTVVYTPQRRVYDGMGIVSLSPTTPNTGAGIATLNPIPEIPPGDIDLIAPLGTVDAGEAGIRVSGNVNVAALRVVNAENIQVQGKSVGVPTVAAVNVGALTNASATAAQAASAAQEAVARDRASARQNQSSIFSVRMLDAGAQTDSTGKPRADNGPMLRYDPTSPVQVVGQMNLSESQLQALTPTERKNLMR
ncbi:MULTISPECIES: filamentous haemagglutinin family protein [Pandoraea]|uniref:filamentous haemagglutinin family protein n=1 Tax=Pandoraea TaxID=93217 RepID=UPI001F5D0283|nr:MULTISPECIES: filamentous haemagglutinin family protein [Pandoraea]